MREHTRNPAFCARIDTMKQFEVIMIDGKLKAASSASGPSVFALYGLGGVGKI